jgi:ankyrin repeat protein
MNRSLPIVTIAAATLIGSSLRSQESAANPQLNRAELCAKADSLSRAAQRGCVEKVQELLAAQGVDSKNGSESEALRSAIRAGNKEITELLVKAGAPVNPAQTVLWSPLADAAFAKQFEIMKLLVESGAKVDAVDHRGVTLLVSMGYFDPTVATILLDAGANPNAAEREGETALMRAAAHGLKQTVKLLIDHHADVNQKDARGRTALMHAADSRYSKAIPLLLENGADPTARDHEGLSALEMADKSNNLGAIAMLSLAVKRFH